MAPSEAFVCGAPPCHGAGDASNGRGRLVALDDDVEDHDQHHHRDEQDRRDLSRPAVLGRRMTVIAHAGGPGTVPGPRARG